MNFGTKTRMAERLKKDKVKDKGANTRTKTELLMTLEGGMASKMQVMENLSLLSAVFEDVVCAVENLEAHYEDVGDSVRLSGVANEFEGLEKDFSDIEGVVKGYLSGSPSHNSTLNGSRTTPIGQSALKDQSERLEEEIRKRERELKQVVDILEKTTKSVTKS